MNDNFLSNESEKDPLRGGENGGALATLLAAAGLTALLWFVPFAQVLTYPFRILVTFLHEGGHALAALATGGQVEGIRVFANGSGDTLTRGGLFLAIVSAGYLGATLYGAGIIALVRRRVSGRLLLTVTGAWIGLLTVGFVRPSANLFGFAWGLGLAAGLFALARFLPARAAGWAVAFVGVQCALNALFDLRTLLGLSWGTIGTPAVTTDAAILAQRTLIPAPVWSVLWIALALAMLWAVLRPARTQRSAV